MNRWQPRNDQGCGNRENTNPIAPKPRRLGPHKGIESGHTSAPAKQSVAPCYQILASESVLLWPGRPCSAYQPSLMERSLTSAHPIRWTECQDSDRFAFRLKSPQGLINRRISRFASNFQAVLSITVSGIQIASSVVAGIFLVNRIRREQAST